MGQKKSEFDKVFSAWDILVIAFGAMIGWGWVVSSGTWIDAGGVVGAALAFAYILHAWPMIPSNSKSFRIVELINCHLRQNIFFINID